MHDYKRDELQINTLERKVLKSIFELTYDKRNHLWRIRINEEIFKDVDLISPV